VSFHGAQVYHSQIQRTPKKENQAISTCFQQGAFLSAVRLSDQRFVTLTEGGYTIKDSFDSLDEWYVRTLRAEYGERYSLPPMVA
jgi:hypothetical protein